MRRLFGIGPRTEERLVDAGISRIAHLTEAESSWLVARFGQAGLEWQRLAQGIDERPIELHRMLKQVSRERTFPQDVVGREELRGILQALVTDLMPAVQTAPPARTVTLKLRYADWTTVTRRQTPGTIVTGEVLAQLVPSLFVQRWGGRPLRLLGVGVSTFISVSDGQLSPFDASFV